MSETDDRVLPETIRGIFKNKRVLIMGDSIMRGIYRDICCLLTNNSRLLNENELIYNRHQSRNNGLFGDQIDQLHIDRTNSTCNIEKRSLTSELFKFYVSYQFCSRIWNTQIKNNISFMNNYNLIIIQSFIWDLTRYNDHEGEDYMKNLDLFLLNVKSFHQKLLWVILPPSESTQSTYINNLLNKLNPMIIEKLETNQINFINLANCSQKDVEIRHRDGIHFTPIGHRIITEKILEHTKKMNECTNETINDMPAPVINNSSANICPPVIRKQGDKRKYPHQNRRNLFHQNQNYLENRSDQMKYRRDIDMAKEFGSAFGTAWKAFKSSD